TAATPAGVYHITIDAANGQTPAASQVFTLTVETAPAITSADNASFTAGTATDFTIQTTGVPDAAITTADSLPTGVTLVDNGNGTATLASTAATPAGVYAIHLSASNGVSPAATQTFTLTVVGPPTITSADNTTFTAGTAGSFIVQTTGGPFPAITTADTLPTGVTLVDNGDGTATLASTTDAAAGSYTIHIDASNGNSPNAAQTFTLTIS
ncbi:MAG TPA: hypothetical protein VHC19_06985, partial [Pirellulales bacterium]|nr:hypothetical protein [Pirellulales bacterium]